MTCIKVLYHHLSAGIEVNHKLSQNMWSLVSKYGTSWLRSTSDSTGSRSLKHDKSIQIECNKLLQKYIREVYRHLHGHNKVHVYTSLSLWSTEGSTKRIFLETWNEVARCWTI